MCVILAASLFAQIFASDFGNVKISHVVIDQRGATFEADLYVPAGTRDSDQLPAIIVTHGRGAHFGQEKGFSEELSRRGYVVINTAAYGTATSEMPFRDDAGQGEEDYFIDNTPQGVIDTLNYLRSLKYVDTSRIGILGHSSGSRKAGFAAIMDCGYYSFNDIMLNTLTDTFGISIREDQLYMDADEIARENLDAAAMEYYSHIKAENQAAYESKIKSLVLIGSDANKVGLTATVTVAGHEVTRTCKVNFCIIDGEWDFSYRNYAERETSMEAWYTGTEPIAEDTWYALDDEHQSSSQLGQFGVAQRSDLEQAIEARSTRLFMISEKESHAKNVLSAQTNAAAIDYFDMTLGHRSPIASGNSFFMFRVVMNGIALLAMLFMILPLVGLIYLSKNENELCVTNEIQQLEKKQYFGLSLFTIVLTFYAIYRANGGNYSPFAPRPLANIFRVTVTGRNISIFVVYVGILSALALALIALFNKRNQGKLEWNSTNIARKPIAILKDFGRAVAVIIVCYTSLLVIRYLFNQDYRLWIGGYTDMKVEYWAIVGAYALLFLPCFLLNGMAVNATIRKDIPEWKDTLNTVVINSAGLWLCCLWNIISMLFFDKPFSLFTATYDMVLLIPILTYFTRKFYKITGSVWFGAFLNALLVAWNLVSTTGINDRFYQIGFFSRLFNI